MVCLNISKLSEFVRELHLINKASPNPNITEFDNIPIAILKNNKADLLKKLGISFDTDNGLALSPELPQLANIYGYQINGSADNPIISAK